MNQRSFNNGNNRSPFQQHQLFQMGRGRGHPHGHSTPPPPYFQESGPSGFTSPPPPIFSPNRSFGTPPGGSPNFPNRQQQRTPQGHRGGYQPQLQGMNNSGQYRTPSPFNSQNSSGRYSSYNDSRGRHSFNDSRRGRGSFNRGGRGGGGGSGNIEDYYKESMVQDPWTRFNLDEGKHAQLAE